MVATIADIQNLESLRRSFEISGDDIPLVVDDDFSDNLYGFNNGKVAKIASQRRLLRMGVPEYIVEPFQRAVGWHEIAVHGCDKEVQYNGRHVFLPAVSDKNKKEHENAHRMAMKILGDVDPDAAIAMEYVKNIGSDGGDELSEYIRRCGGGLAGKNEGLFKRLYKSIAESLYEQYKPFEKPMKNTWGYALNKAGSKICGFASNFFPQGNFFGEVVKDAADGLDSVAMTNLQNVSPLARTLTIGFGVGRTNIERIYTYVDSMGNLWPIFWTTYDKPDAPTADKTDEGVKYVKTNQESPLKNVTGDQSNRIMNPVFMQRHMRNYLGSEFHDRYYKDEMGTIGRWLPREDTKGSSLWLRDTAAESGLPSYVRVYKRNVGNTGIIPWIGKHVYNDDRPMSFGMASSVAWHDICQDIVGAVYGAPIAGVFEKAHIPPEAIRRAILKSFKLGSNLASNDFPFRYD